MAWQRVLDPSRRKPGKYSPYGEPMPGDEVSGQWTSEKLQRMDQRFRDRMERVLSKDKADQTKR